MTGHKSQKVFDGYYNILKEIGMKNNDKIFSTELKEVQSEESSGISKHQEEQSNQIQISFR
jgi:hypothetical protein